MYQDRNAAQQENIDSEAFLLGKVETSMWANSKIIKILDKAFSPSQVVTNTVAGSKIVVFMDKAPIPIKVAE